MPTLRRVTVTFALPLLYLAVIYLGMRPPKPTYRSDAPTVMTVTDRGGPAILHDPGVIYPARALRDGVEGRVSLKVTIASDGTVTQAVPIWGPAALRQAAVENARHWQFEAKAQETQLDIGFSLSAATRSLALPEPVRRTLPVYRGKLRGSVRVVAMVDPEGRVEFVQPVTGPEILVGPAVECVKRWTFRPMLRDGKPVRGTAVVDVPFGL